MRLNLPPDEYYKQLAKVPTSGGAIFKNSKDEYLIVRQTYKINDNYYNIVGGTTNDTETPREAVIREVKEEIGLEIKNPKLFCVDYATSKPYDRILFVFNCGILDEGEVAKIKVDTDEIEKYAFVSYEKMMELLSPRLAKRIANSFDGFTNGTCAYLENGERV